MGECKDKCKCGAPANAISFDRSICWCGSMHYFCEECGEQSDACYDATLQEKLNAALDSQDA